MAGVTLGPGPHRFVAIYFLVEIFPEILVHHGFFAAVIQPFFFQPWIQVVIPFFRYSESVTTSTSQFSLSARKSFDRGAQFHTVVGGVRLAIPRSPSYAGCSGESRPIRRTRIAMARAVGDSWIFFNRSTHQRRLGRLEKLVHQVENCRTSCA
jgi:hypothetical protein